MRRFADEVLHNVNHESIPSILITGDEVLRADIIADVHDSIQELLEAHLSSRLVTPMVMGVAHVVCNDQ